MTPIIERDGKFYLLESVCGEKEGWDDFDVAVVEITPAAIQNWRVKMDLADRLEKEHGISEIWFPDYSASYYPADCDAEPLGEDYLEPPDWSAQPARTDCDRCCIQARGYLYWWCEPKYSDYSHPFATHGSDRNALDELEKALDELMKAKAAA